MFDWILAQEKQLKEKVQDEVAKAIIAKAKNDAPFSVSEYEAIVSQIKKEAAEARAEIMEAMGMVPKSMRFLSFRVISASFWLQHIIYVLIVCTIISFCGLNAKS